VSGTRGSVTEGLGAGADGAAPGEDGVSGPCTRGVCGVIAAGLALAGTTGAPRFAPSPSAISDKEFSFPLGSRF
jgi:hypothetical protein